MGCAGVLLILVLSALGPALGELDEAVIAADTIAEAKTGLLPPAVVVHGRQGPNSDLNGVYIQDFAYSRSSKGVGAAIGPCYRRSGAPSGKVIFLYFEGEWRIGPSPERGSVWAFSRSRAGSPLLIDKPWEVWDGHQVQNDTELRVSDTSVIPPVLFLSIHSDDAALRSVQGMLLQQPGLWEGRPYYRHRAFPQLYLLCSAAEGRWRLGSLLVGAVPTPPLLFSHSASALPTEVPGDSWNLLRGDEALLLAADTVHFAPYAYGQRVHDDTAIGTLQVDPSRPPRHLLVEGVQTEEGVANGIYRRASELLNDRPVYHKADAQTRSACLWFASDWRFGRLVLNTPDSGSASGIVSQDDVWLYAPSVAVSPLEVRAVWRRPDDGRVEAVRIADAAAAIPSTVTVAGSRYVQQPKLCDARPVYLRQVDTDEADPSQRQDSAVYLFFRSQENEWWLGPTIGGTECYARAPGSPHQVVPDFNGLAWRAAEEPRALPPLRLDDAWPGGRRTIASGKRAAEAMADAAALNGDILVPAGSAGGERSWWPWVVATLVLLIGAAFKPGRKQGTSSSTVEASGAAMFTALHSPRNSPAGGGSETAALACVVCYTAPRDVLLVPCRHVCCCRACADRLDQCPVCRTPTTAHTKVYL